MKLKIFSMIDYLLLACVLLLTTLGIVFIYSSGINSDGVLVSNEYLKQIVWASVGLVAMTITVFFDYRRFERVSHIMYAAILVVLLYTRIFGRYVNGARSWIGIGELGIQPSEITKIIFILFLARFLCRSRGEASRIRFIKALAIMAGPMGLILIQPDMGTASVYLPIFLFMCFMANIPIRYLMLVLVTGMLTIVFTVLPIYESSIVRSSIPVVHVLTNTRLRLIAIGTCTIVAIIGLIGRILTKRTYYYWIMFVFGVVTLALLASIAGSKVLKPYQIQRLIVFLDPYSDSRGAGWNIIQSKIAIGSGNLWGRGFMHGTQSHYRFLPQQSTDFIFSILSEEIGFAGGIFVYSLFLVILLRIIAIVKKTSNLYGSYIAMGILGMFFFHFIVNVGMVMGIMPITGIPLPFLSYGGSALLTNMIAIGLLMSISSRHLDFMVV
ncbi:MAG: rod shape-determining protein RodA [Treponema sp.]|nr:rod shape-determining protein RodA [Treponema sp.]